MTFHSGLMSILRDSNPVPDPDMLVGSAEADELALRRPGSIIDWRSDGDSYIGDNFQIRLAEPGRWTVTLRGTHFADYRSLRMAFAAVERHRRQTLRRRGLGLWTGLATASLVAIVIGVGSAEPAGFVTAAGAFLVLVGALIRIGTHVAGRAWDNLRNTYQ